MWKTSLIVTLLLGMTPSLLPGQQVGPSPPVAAVAGPNTINLGHEVILNFVGTQSQSEPEYGVALAPEGSSIQIIPLYSEDQSLVYGIAVPDKPGLYRFVVIATAENPANPKKPIRRYAFLDVSVADQSSPLPGPPPRPVDPAPTPTPGPVPTPSPVTDTYGFYSYSKNLLALMPNSVSKLQAPQVADVFSNMVSNVSRYQSAQKFVTDTATTYKTLLGPNYTLWHQYFFGPVATRLTDLASKGQIPQDVSAQVQVWRELAAALKEVK